MNALALALCLFAADPEEEIRKSVITGLELARLAEIQRVENALKNLNRQAASNRGNRRLMIALRKRFDAGKERLAELQAINIEELQATDAPPALPSMNLLTGKIVLGDWGHIENRSIEVINVIDEGQFIGMVQSSRTFESKVYWFKGLSTKNLVDDDSRKAQNA